MNTYDIGDSVRVTGTYTNVSGAATAPTTSSLSVTKPSGTVVSPAPTLTNGGTGVMFSDVAVDEEGRWLYRFTGTVATYMTASEGSFVVRKKLTV